MSATKDIDQLRTLRTTHSRRLSIIENRIALEGRKADPADIVEAEDIKRRVLEIDERIYRLNHNIRDDEVMFTYDQILELTNITMEEYKKSVLVSFSKILDRSGSEITASHLNAHRKSSRRFIILNTCSVIFGFTIIFLADRFNIMNTIDLIMTYSLYIYIPMGILLFTFIIYGLFIKPDFTAEDFQNNKEERNSTD